MKNEMKLEIVAVKESFQQTGTTITGIIYWSICDTQFPENQWNDYVITILAQWVQSGKNLLANSLRETLDFMDGPYTVECKCEGELVECVFVDRHAEGRVLSYWKGSTVDLVRTILEAGTKALQVCEDQKFTCDSIALLRKRILAAGEKKVRE